MFIDGVYYMTLRLLPHAFIWDTVKCINTIVVAVSAYTISHLCGFCFLRGLPPPRLLRAGRGAVRSEEPTRLSPKRHNLGPIPNFQHFQLPAYAPLRRLHILYLPMRLN